jgi:hypothetical protein
MIPFLKFCGGAAHERAYVEHLESTGLDVARVNGGDGTEAMQLPSLLLAFFERFEERVNGLKLGGKNCPTLGSVGKALF